jgi:uncharacterized coiled-coil DUF342 family protein
MSEDEFSKLFKYLEKRFDGIEKQLEAARRDRADIRGAVAELGAQIRDYHHEMVFLSHQVDKLKQAILQIAQETGVNLAVEL